MTGPGSRWSDLAAAAAPELDLTPIALVETGWDSRVLHAVDAAATRWIFRFPRRREVVADVMRERRVLTLLRAQDLPFAVPDWQFHSWVPCDDGEQLVIGYPELPGSPAAAEPRGDSVFDFAIAMPPPPPYAATLGAALAALHAVDAPTLAHVSAAELRAETSALLDAAQQIPVPSALLAHWQRWIDEDHWWDFPTVLRHGDVHPGHTMIDETAAVVGVIDWTDAGVGDPATDFVDPRHAFGAVFGDELLAAYRAAGGVGAAGGAIGSIAGRVVRWQSFAPVSAALFGLEHERADLVATALERLQVQAARLACGRPPV